MSDTRPATTPERVTIRTVAAHAGVSVAAVSKVLRNAYGVSDGMRRTVTDAIDRLGYRPSVAARGMRGSTFTVGILLIEIANPFLPEIVNGIGDVLRPSDYKSLVGIGEENTPIEASMIESMIDHGMDGLILVAPRMGGEVLADFAARIPIVAVSHHEASAMTFDTVNCDDERGAALATEALLSRGHEDITMVSLDEGERRPTSVVAHRENGYLAAMAAAGLKQQARVVRLPPGKRGDIGYIRTFLERKDRPRAIFCWSDLDAVHLVNVARAIGLDVPGDMAIVGFDNSPVAALPLIGLASVDQSPRRLGALAGEAVLSRVGGRSVPLHHLVAPALVVRPSLETAELDGDRENDQSGLRRSRLAY